MAIQKWTHDEITQIRCDFLAGMNIKSIANKIGKTPSAVNKALSRFGVRREKNNMTAPQKLPQKKNTIKAQNHGYMFRYLHNFLHRDLENWVKFYEVCTYLRKQKIHVKQQLSLTQQPLAEQSFRIGNKTYSAMHVLLIANKLREEQNLSTFFVSGLTW